ncbi:MAG: caspase family protein [Deltaproteobacteria bacterium]|nr:caspase family protein [Deltaproteobacteria bacterium]
MALALHRHNRSYINLSANRIEKGRPNGLPFLFSRPMPCQLWIYWCIIIFLILPPNAYPQPQESQRGIEIKETAQPPDITIKGDYWALIIGINKYPNLPAKWQLEGAVPDARAVKDMLIKKYGFAEERVVFISDEQATRKGIITWLRELSKSIKEQDNLFIYYAGHGVYESESESGWWIPSNAELEDTSSYISNAEIRDAIRTIKAKHILTVADSCFSKSLLGGATRSLGEQSIKQVYQDKSRQVITSGGLKPVLDKGEGGHSVFANSLLRLLDSNQDKYLTSSEIFPKLRDSVSNATSGDQVPVSGVITGVGDENGDFIFINNKLAKAVEPAATETLKTKEDEIKFQEQQRRLEEETKKKLEEVKREMEKMKLEAERAIQEEREKLEQERIARDREQKRLEDERKRLEEERKKKEKRWNAPPVAPAF